MPGGKEPRNQDAWRQRTKNQDAKIQRKKSKENKEPNKFQIKNLKGSRISHALEIFYFLYYFIDPWFYFVFLLWILASWFLGSSSPVSCFLDFSYSDALS